MTNAAQEWTSVGTFDTVIAAARRLSVLHHTGRMALYGIRRRAS